MSCSDIEVRCENWVPGQKNKIPQGGCAGFHVSDFFIAFNLDYENILNFVLGSMPQ